MITFRASEDELDISGSPKELRELKASLKSLKDMQSFRVTANIKAVPKPYDFVLCAFEAVASGGPVRVSVSNQALRVTGSAEMLEVFAQLLRLLRWYTSRDTHSSRLVAGKQICCTRLASACGPCRLTSCCARLPSVSFVVIVNFWPRADTLR